VEQPTASEEPPPRSGGGVSVANKNKTNEEQPSQLPHQKQGAKCRMDGCRWGSAFPLGGGGGIRL